MNFRRTVRLLILAAIVVLAAGCSAPSSSPAPSEPSEAPALGFSRGDVPSMDPSLRSCAMLEFEERTMLPAPYVPSSAIALLAGGTLRTDLYSSPDSLDSLAASSRAALSGWEIVRDERVASRHDLDARRVDGARETRLAIEITDCGAKRYVEVYRR